MHRRLHRISLIVMRLTRYETDARDSWYKDGAMALGRPKAQLVVAPGERAWPVEWTRRRTAAQALALQARMSRRA